MKNSPAGVSTSLLQAAEAMMAKESALTADAVASNIDTEPGTVSRLNGVTVSGDKLLMEAVFRDVGEAEVLAALEAAGIELIDASGQTLLTVNELITASGSVRTFVGGWVPADKLLDLPTMIDGSAGNFVGATQISMSTSVGAVTSQGDVAQSSDDARTNFGVDGTGITVGILSDSYGAEIGSDGETPTATTVAQDVASGDLPANVLILQEGTAISSDGDEGRAMAQIIHDVAPGADLAFHTANFGQGNFASGILELGAPVSSGGADADVIVDDIIYFAEPIFQDGIIAQAAESVIADGKVYLSSAGNNGDDGFADVFNDSGVDGDTIPILVDGTGFTGLGNLHDWNDDPNVFSPYVELTLDDGDDFSISFQWDEPYASAGGLGSTSDFDIFVTRVDASQPNGEEFIDQSFVNNINGDPVEIVEAVNETGSTQTYRIYITEFDPSDTVSDQQLAGVFFSSAGGTLVESFNPQILINNTGGTGSAPQFGAPTVFGHTNAEGVLGVGAGAWFNTPIFNAGLSQPRLNAFSSLAGNDILFDDNGQRLTTPSVRDGVDFVGPDGGNTTFFGNDTSADDDDFPNFFGTSAAAPHAAAVVALMLERNPTLTPAQVEQILEANTGFNVTLDNLGRNRNSPDWVGTGYLDANAAVGAVTATQNNSEPTAQPDLFGVLEDASGAVVGNVFADNGSGADTDPDNDNLTVAAVQGSAANVGQTLTLASGALILLESDGSFTYDPDGRFQSLSVGSTTSDTVTYEISDGNNGTAQSTITITVTGENDTPVAVDDLIAVPVSSGTILSLNVVSNDTDPDLDDTLTVTSLDLTGTAGAVSILPDGLSVNYDPTAAFANLAPGEIVAETFGYTISDGNGGVATAQVSLAVVGEAQLAIEDDDFTVLVASGGSDTVLDVFSNDSTPATSLVISGFDASNLLGRIVSFDAANGLFNYDGSPALDNAGIGIGGPSLLDGFTYTATDSDGESASASVEITVQRFNPATDGDDVADGTAFGDVVDLQAGNDLVDGLAGDDALDGGAGNDTVDGGEGSDLLIGGDGDDLLIGDVDSELEFGIMSALSVTPSATPQEAVSVAGMTPVPPGVLAMTVTPIFEQEQSATAGMLDLAIVESLDPTALFSV